MQTPDDKHFIMRLFLFCWCILGLCSTFSRHFCTENVWSFLFFFPFQFILCLFLIVACKCHCIYCIFCKENIIAVCLLQTEVEVDTVIRTSVNTLSKYVINKMEFLFVAYLVNTVWGAQWFLLVPALHSFAWLRY